MKKIICCIIALVLSLSLISCGVAPTGSGTFFPDNDRFILVDEGRISGVGDAYILADSVTGVLYMYTLTNFGYYSGLTPLFCADGSLMLYDPG